MLIAFFSNSTDYVSGVRFEIKTKRAKWDLRHRLDGK